MLGKEAHYRFTSFLAVVSPVLDHDKLKNPHERRRLKGQSFTTLSVGTPLSCSLPEEEGGQSHGDLF